MKFPSALALSMVVLGCAHPVTHTRPGVLDARFESILAASDKGYAIEQYQNLPALPAGGLTDHELAHLRVQLAQISFPAKRGTVERLLPFQIFPTSRLDGDAFGAPNGYIGGTVREFTLNEGFVLRITQDHYDRAGRVLTVDKTAEIVSQGKRLRSE